MDIRVTFSDDPAWVLSTAGRFLASQPVLHNLVLSLLHVRAARSEPGRYWVAHRDKIDGDKVAGVVFQSPLTFAATLTPMEPDVTVATVNAIADAGIALPGVNGEAATAATFAGHWTERHKSAAVPTHGQRIYEFLDPQEAPAIEGRLRKAIPKDHNLVASWTRAFHEEVHEPLSDPDALVNRLISTGQVWLWDNGQPISMAVGREPVEGVVRVSGVYTPPEHRQQGYAAACVLALSQSIRQSGHRCMLYTDLGNPTSNSIYRRIGYKAVAEVLRYRFA
jgi:ribosomal protein S18 acetylase RimI-like enzyme